MLVTRVPGTLVTNIMDIIKSRCQTIEAICLVREHSIGWKKKVELCEIYTKVVIMCRIGIKWNNRVIHSQTLKKH